MSGWVILAMVVSFAGILLLALFVVLAGRSHNQSRGVEMHASGPDTYSLRTPVGGAEARIVVKDGLGRCYEVRTKFRGEPVNLAYVLPTAAMVRSHVEREVQANINRRRDGKRIAS